ncbi:related to phosphatidylinositol transfer protein [Cephalotrichum gorgonifer]|uniref:Related to phosphatidylinositol transfer protein n=1 Tax=Cephalotrichum gorgonifer TaxID=2041049 RepID=A0AAE8N408_9PEZI|nr:related to phosphatidylinositol transfer protein [Cephalotrichum gorgonifer]
MTTANTPAGRPGNLTPEQEESLRRLWSLLFRVFGRDTTNEGAVDLPGPDAPATEQPAAAQAEKAKKKKGLFSRRTADTPSPGGSAVFEPSSVSEADGDDKHGQVRQYLDTLANMSPDSIRETMWAMVKHDNPDALLLRFLRARKWDVERALVMLIATMNWRAVDMHVDDDIMRKGEGDAAAAEKGQDGAAKTLGHDFLAQMRMGKAFLHGLDKAGRPICFVRVRLHHQGDHSEEALERNTVYIIETCRMLLAPPVDTATIVFDMTGFSLSNMDYTPVKFMIKCFEANYPESLGTVLVYKAPWVFQGIWKIIRGWLDPVVASKVQFLNNAKEMAAFVDLTGLPKEVDGLEEWNYHYDEPVEGENAKMADTATRDRISDARQQLIAEYEQETLRWIKRGSGDTAAACKESRTAIAAKLRENYWELDPYIRARSLWDRTGMIKPGGVLDFYPHRNRNGATSNGNSGSAVETSADDVD